MPAKQGGREKKLHTVQTGACLANTEPPASVQYSC